MTSPGFEFKTLVFVVAFLVPSELPSVNWENGDDVRDAVTVTARVLLAENPRTSLTDEDTQKAEEKALPTENARVKDSVCYLKRETAPRYSNCSAAPLLKRHAA